MKTVIASIYILTFFNVLSQNSTNSLDVTEHQTLYRNVSNTINILNPDDQYEVECPLCETIEKNELPNTYNLIPNRRAKITKVFVKNKESDTVSTLIYLNDNLPYPVLFFGGVRNGRKCTLEDGQITAQYPSEMNLNFESKVEKWALYSGDKKFEGTGTEISEEAMTYLKSENNLEAFSIIAIVRGPDGIGRRVGGAYSL